MLRKHLVDVVDDMFEPVREAVRAFRPDAMVCDATTTLAPIDAQDEKERWLSADISVATLGEGPADLSWAYRQTISRIYADRERLYARYGATARFRLQDVFSPELHLVFTIPEFPSPDLLQIYPGTHCVGASFPADTEAQLQTFPWRSLSTDKPIIYCEPDELIWWRRPDVIRIVSEAAVSLGAQLVVSGKEFASSADAKQLGDHAITVDSAPRLQLLRRASVYVTHSDMTGVTQAFCAGGVPMLALPFFADMPLFGHYIERSHCGLSISMETPAGAPPRIPTVADVRSALAHLLSPPSGMRKALDELAAKFVKVDGGLNAALRIDAYCSDRAQQP